MDLPVSKFFPELMKQFDANNEVSYANLGWILQYYDPTNQDR